MFYGSDVAIYVLAEPITDIKPLRFAKAHLSRDEIGKPFTAVGYGIRDRDGRSGQRRAGTVTLRGRRQADAGDLRDQGRLLRRSGDSGGPLVHEAADGELEVAAVVSGSFRGLKYNCSVLGESYATLGPKVQEMIRDTQACKGVPIDGRCEGTVAVRCVSDAEGPQKITKSDCGRINQICKLDANNKASCADEEPAPPPPTGDAGPG